MVRKDKNKLFSLVLEVEMESDRFIHLRTCVMPVHEKTA